MECKLPMKTDAENNNIERNPNLGYSESISKTITVPNVLINTVSKQSFLYCSF